MKNKKLLYSSVLLLAVTAVVGGFFAAKVHTANQHKNAVQPKQVTPSNVVMIPESDSKHVEKPFVTTLQGVPIPDDAALRGAILNQSLYGNGQGAASFSYKAPMEGKKEYVRFYIQNIGDKKLYVLLKSPLGNPWIKTSVEPGTVFDGEMQWGLAQEGQWICNLSNDDGSVISARVVLTKTSQ